MPALKKCLPPPRFHPPPLPPYHKKGLVWGAEDVGGRGRGGPRVANACTLRTLKPWRCGVWTNHQWNQRVKIDKAPGYCSLDKGVAYTRGGGG